MLHVLVYCLSAHFSDKELNFLKKILNNKTQGFGQYIQFSVHTSKTKPLRTTIETCIHHRCIVLFKLSPSRIKRLYPDEKEIHGMSFTTLHTDPTFIVMNTKNWNSPPSSFTLSRDKYRTYLINHEFGHALGLHSHQSRTKSNCPLMYQQTRGTIGCSRIDLYPTTDQVASVVRFVQQLPLRNAK